ncbi:MAG: hypothetical protein AAF547_02070 [Actinomycetota bacterium]
MVIPRAVLAAMAPALALAATAACSGGDTTEAQPTGTTVAADAADDVTVAGDGTGVSGDDPGPAGDETLTGTPAGVDLDPSGNRVVSGPAALATADPIDIPVPATPIWIVPFDGAWIVVLDDGRAIEVEIDTGGTSTVTDLGPGPVDHPLLVFAGADGPVVASVLDHPLRPLFTDPLPDTRIVTADGVAAALVQPTDRYPHGVLGDQIEAAAVAVVPLDGSGGATTFGPDPPTVIEGVSPLLADLDGDGRDEVIVTHANGEVGAWLAAWTLDGELVAESEPIGRGNRWRNQLAAAATAPDGTVELIDVRTPHIGGTIQYFQLRNGELQQTGAAGGVHHPSHRQSEPRRGDRDRRRRGRSARCRRPDRRSPPTGCGDPGRDQDPNRRPPRSGRCADD